MQCRPHLLGFRSFVTRSPPKQIQRRTSPPASTPPSLNSAAAGRGIILPNPTNSTEMPTMSSGPGSSIDLGSIFAAMSGEAVPISAKPAVWTEPEDLLACIFGGFPHLPCSYSQELETVWGLTRVFSYFTRFLKVGTICFYHVCMHPLPLLYTIHAYRDKGLITLSMLMS